METVNLEKICELLEKGVDNPLIQNEERKFSLEKWKKEIQPYTEPFLSVLTDKLNEVLAQEKDVWMKNEFKIARTDQSKKIRIMSLQHATCKLPEQFGITIDGGRRRHFRAFIILAPSDSTIEEKYRNCIMWGLRMFGTAANAEIARQLLLSLNQGLGFTVSLSKYKALGGSYAWLFNSIGANEVMEVGLDHIVDIIIKDFVKLSSILYKNRDRFPPPPPGPPGKGQEDLPTKADVEKAIRFVHLNTGQKEISKEEVFDWLEIEFRRREISLKSDWKLVTGMNLDIWFG